MRNIQRKTDNTDSMPDNVIRFVKDFDSPSSMTENESIVDDIIANPKFAEHIKEQVESAIMGLWMESRMFSSDRNIDPFDAIYISALMPDNIDFSETNRILEYKNIKDLSDTIIFKDDWED